MPWGTVARARRIEAQGPDRTLPMVTALRAEPISARTRWPVMSNYASNKSTPLSSGQVFQVRIGFSERVKHAAKIIVIGARPNDHDHHIWAPMRACTAEVLYVGGDYARLGVSRSRPLGLTFKEAWTPLLSELDAIAAS